MVPVWLLRSLGFVSFILLVIGAAFPEWERFNTGMPYSAVSSIYHELFFKII